MKHPQLYSKPSILQHVNSVSTEVQDDDSDSDEFETKVVVKAKKQ